MEKIKEILFKKHYIREIMTLFFIVLSLLFLSIYTSLAIFTDSYEIKTVATIQASTINITMSTLEQPSETTTKNITVSAGETYFTNITLTNNTNTIARYKMYYSANIDDSVKIGVSSASYNKGSESLNSTGIDGYKKMVRVGIENSSDNDVAVTIGVQSGYGHNDITLSEGNELTTITEIDNLCDIPNSLMCNILGSSYEKVTNTLPTFSTTSTDRGLFVQHSDTTKSIDGKPTYYFKGSSTNDTINSDYVMNNYVKFGKYKTTDGDNTIGKDIIWRIVRINEDGTIKLIGDSKISATTAWNSKGIANYVNEDGTDSEIKSLLESWYSSNLGSDINLDNKIVESSFCSDISDDYKAAAKRLGLNTPTFVCPIGAITVNSKIGTITADEMMYGGSLVYRAVENNPSYLSFETWFWTLTPASSTTAYEWAKENFIRPFGITDTSNMVLRPVINLKSDVTISSGDGLSADTAYVINLD